MMPQMRDSIAAVIIRYYNEAKTHYNQYAFNKKPKDHVFKDLQYLKEQLKVKRRLSDYTLTCKGVEEISFLANFMKDLTESLHLSLEQAQWTEDLYDEILVYCLQEYPRTRNQKHLHALTEANKALTIGLDDGKRLILARIRKMLLTQNI